MIDASATYSEGNAESNDLESGVATRNTGTHATVRTMHLINGDERRGVSEIR